MQPTFRHLRTIAAVAVLAAGLAVAPATFAQEEVEEMGMAHDSWGLEFSAGIDFTTHYFFRGILQEDQGLIAQPWAEVSTTLWEGDGAFHNLTATVGTWNSVHSAEDTGETGPSDNHWYESDIYLTLGTDVADKWNVSATYMALISPNNSFATIHELGFTVKYDDSDMWGDGGYSLSPYATVVVELDDEADGGNSKLGNSGGDEGVYYAFGIEPSFVLLPEHDITISFPTEIAFGCDYYEQDTNDDGRIDDDSSFGYVRTGVALGIPMTAFSPNLDRWNLSVGVDFWFLGDTNEDVNNGDDFETVGTIGVSTTF